MKTDLPTKVGSRIHIKGFGTYHYRLTLAGWVSEQRLGRVIISRTILSGYDWEVCDCLPTSK